VPVPFLRTDPPIDFTPRLKILQDGGVEIESGFLRAQIYRVRQTHFYRVADAYREEYHLAHRVRSLLSHPGLYPQLRLTSSQAKELDEAVNRFCRELCGPHFSDKKASDLRRLLLGLQVEDHCPGDPDWLFLFVAYKEAPGWLHDEAEAELCESVRVFSQNYHAGSIELAGAAERILTKEQLAALP
jgi:hypothetical protein